MVRDEADIIEATVRQMASQVDRVLVADNGSEDGTRDILEQLAIELPVIVTDDPEPGYFQSRKMTGLAHEAAAGGAEWVVAFDADEFWYSPFGRIADVLAGHPGAVVAADIFDHVATARDDQAEADPVKRIGWRRRASCPLHKIACRPTLPVTIAQGNHGAVYPSLQPLTEQVVIRHFPHRSVEQLVRKVRNGAAAYAATDLPFAEGQHWREWGQLLEQSGEEAIADLFATWYFSAEPEADGELILDPAPCGLR